MSELLSIEDLTVSFGTSAGRVKALNNVSLTLNEGEVLCIVGESGSGKSTLALTIMGLLPHNTEISDGRIMYRDIDLLRAGADTMRDLRGREISLVFQDAQSALNPIESIGPQLEEVILAHSNVSLRGANQMAQDMLFEMGMADPKRVMGQFPFALSGGMCQRVMLAIALINRPKLLIADESTSALDVTLQAELMERLKLLSQDFGTAILFISHDLGVVANMAHHVGVMYAGTLVESAEVMELFGQPRHPYTLSMMQASPRLDNPDKTLTSLRGVSPDMSDLPTGCPFLPRCNKATLTCRSSSRPLLNDIGRDHLVACYNPVSY